jgi:hypothetical protein
MALGGLINMVYSLLIGLFGSGGAPSTWVIGGVTMPIGASKIQLTGGVNKETMPQSGDEPINIVDGLQGTTLNITGTIADESKSDGDLWVDVISPLLAQKGTEVTVACPISGLNGNWLLEGFDVTRDSKLSIYDFSMKLTRGSQNIILTA